MSAHIVDPSKIQSELSKISGEVEKGNKKRSASLFNLIIYTQKNSRTEYIHAIAQKVIEKFPSRVIFISVDKTAPKEQLKTAVSVMTAASGEFIISCDLIEILSSKEMEEKVPFIILPHLIPDLPIYLLWAEDPSLESPLFKQLETYATRLIFDSESTDNLTQFAKTLLKEKASSKCDIADLNWARTEHLREVLVTSFNTPEKIKSLFQTTAIKIAYNCKESPFFCHPKVQAIYLQSWLATRLNLTLKQVSTEKDNLVFTYSRDNMPVTITLEHVRNEHFPTGMVIDLEFSSKEGFHYSFIRDASNTHQIIATYSTNEKCEMPERFIFPKTGSGQSLVKEIFHKGTSAHYLKVLDLINAMKLDK